MMPVMLDMQAQRTADAPPLTVAEVALELGCSAHTVRRLVESHQLTAFRLGASGTWRIRRADLERFVNVNARSETRA